MTITELAHYVRPRWLRPGGLLAACLSFAGCMIEPFDGQTVREGDWIAFQGYAPAPDATIVIEVEVPDPDPEPCDDTRIAPEDAGSASSPLCARSYEFVPVERARPNDAAGGGLRLFDAESTRFYHWNASVRLPPEAFRSLRTTDGRWVRGARVRARQEGGFVYTTLAEDWASCYDAHHRTMDDFHTHCSANPDHVAVLVAE